MKRNHKFGILISSVFILLLAFSLSASAEELAVEASENANIFAELFSYVKSYATEIICTITLIGSIVLSYTFKKGLLPLVKNALSAIGTSVGKLKESTDEGEKNAERLTALIDERLAALERLVGGSSERLEEVCREFDGIKESEEKKEGDAKRLSLIVSEQIEMLYDIFMTSALPQYQKDNVGTRVAKMREALGENEKTD